MIEALDMLKYILSESEISYNKYEGLLYDGGQTRL